MTCSRNSGAIPGVDEPPMQYKGTERWAVWAAGGARGAGRHHRRPCRDVIGIHPVSPDRRGDIWATP